MSEVIFEWINKMQKKHFKFVLQEQHSFGKTAKEYAQKS